MPCFESITAMSLNRTGSCIIPGSCHYNTPLRCIEWKKTGRAPRKGNLRRMMVPRLSQDTILYHKTGMTKIIVSDKTFPEVSVICPSYRRLQFLLMLSVPPQSGTSRRDGESSPLRNSVNFLCCELTPSRPKAGRNVLACRFHFRQDIRYDFLLVSLDCLC